MKKSLKSICILLTFAITMGLTTSCSKASDNKSETGSRSEESSEATSQTTVVETETSSEESESSVDLDETTTGAAETTETSGTATTTAKALGKVTVSDAYKKSYGKNEFGYKATVKIPKITIAGVSTTKINKEIYNYCKKKSGNMCSCSYSYYIGKTYVSILITLQEEHDMSPAAYYSVYNISRSSGKKMSAKSMLKTLKISDKKFRSRVKKAVIKLFKKSYGYNSKSPSWVKTAYKQATASKMIKKAIPYVNSKGKLCYMIKDLPCPGGAGQYDECGTC